MTTTQLTTYSSETVKGNAVKTVKVAAGVGQKPMAQFATLKMEDADVQTMTKIFGLDQSLITLTATHLYLT